MQIREGAYYRTRGGRIIGPMKHVDYRAEKWKFWAVGFNDGAPSWTDEGRWCEFDDIHDMDLISEVYVSDTPPAAQETEAQLREMMRDPRYWQKRDPVWIKRVTDGFRALVGSDTPPVDAPETKTMRDEFAMAALSVAWEYAKRGSQSNLTTTTVSRLAYLFADAMMEARKK